MKQLTRREQWGVGIAGGLLLSFLLFQGVIFPLADSRAKLRKGLAAREKAVVEMRSLRDRYQALGQKAGSVATVLAEREEGFSLFSFLEKHAAETEVKEHIASMKPSESATGERFHQSLVEMKLQGISLRQLVDFLEKIESPENLVGVSKMTIQSTGKEEVTLDVTLQVVSVDQVAGQ